MLNQVLYIDVCRVTTQQQDFEHVVQHVTTQGDRKMLLCARAILKTWISKRAGTYHVQQPAAPAATYVCTYVRLYVCLYVRTYVRTYVRRYVCT